jgi:pimeloyl-ACP methyl ester carboxylesterase
VAARGDELVLKPVIETVGPGVPLHGGGQAAGGRDIVPGARVELLPGVGHTPMLEDPQTTGRLLLDFAAAAEATLRS